MDDELLKKICDASRDTAYANGVDDAALHAICDALVKEVKGNLSDYVDLVCTKWM
jgi:hypothetical protein